MKNILTLILLFISYSLWSQSIIIDSTLIVTKTNLKTSGFRFDKAKEIKKDNVTKLIFIEDLMYKALVISLDDSEIKPEIITWNDYAKGSISLPLDYLKIEMNKMKYQVGDTLMMKLECRAKTYKYSGEIKHILEK